MRRRRALAGQNQLETVTLAQLELEACPVQATVEGVEERSRDHARWAEFEAHSGQPQHRESGVVLVGRERGYAVRHRAETTGAAPKVPLNGRDRAPINPRERRPAPTRRRTRSDVDRHQRWLVMAMFALRLVSQPIAVEVSPRSGATDGVARTRAVSLAERLQHVEVADDGGAVSQFHQLLGDDGGLFHVAATCHVFARGKLDHPDVAVLPISILGDAHRGAATRRGRRFSPLTLERADVVDA